jgi:hypothetical protein
VKQNLVPGAAKLGGTPILERPAHRPFSEPRRSGVNVTDSIHRWDQPGGASRPAGYNRRTMQRSLQVRTTRRQEVVDLTLRIAEVVAAAGVAESLCTVFARHATAAIVINENADPGFRADVVAALDRLFPEGVWEHDKVDDNGAAPPRHLAGDRPRGVRRPAHARGRGGRACLTGTRW